MPSAGAFLGVVDVELYTDQIRRLDDPGARDDLFQQIRLRLMSVLGTPVSNFKIAR